MGTHFFYLILRTDGYYDFMASDVRLNPRRHPNELIREIPDEGNVMHPVDRVCRILTGETMCRLAVRKGGRCETD
jgi:hypothetical protein